MNWQVHVKWCTEVNNGWWWHAYLWNIIHVLHDLFLLHFLVTHAAVKVLFKTHPHSNFQPQHTKVRRTTSELGKRDNPRDNMKAALNAIWSDEGIRCRWQGGGAQVRGMRWRDRRIGGESRGKRWEQGRANEADAGRVWREKQVGEEHKNTEGKRRANCCAWHIKKTKGKIIV